MKITQEITAEKLNNYLHHKINLNELVDWAENAMMDGDFNEKNCKVLQEIIGRIGLADVREFGLEWNDVEKFLVRLGYEVKIDIVPKVS